MDNLYTHVLKYISYWLSMSVVFTLKYILDLSLFVSGGIKECKNCTLKVLDVDIFSLFENVESNHSDRRGLLASSPIWSGVGGFVGRLISLFPITCMCLIWLSMNIFYCRLVLMLLLSIQAVMTCTHFHFTLSCWLEMAYKTSWTDVGYFLTLLRIQTFVLFLAGNK